MGPILLTISKEAKEEDISIIELITSGGNAGIIIMSILLILSMLTIYILIERLSILSIAKKEKNTFIEEINNLVNNKQTEEAIQLCSDQNTIIARTIEKGLKRLDHPFNEIHSSMETQGKIEVNNLEKNLTSLATISGAAPMIGFLGTVIGMILAFHNMEHGGTGIEDLGGGIKTAMVTTVGGLIVGVIAYISYNFLLSQIDKIIFRIENDISKFLDNLH